jgi:hypothetical protein
VAASQTHVDGNLVQQTLPIHLIKSIGVEAFLAVLKFVMNRGVRIGALAPSATLVDDWGCNTNTQARPTTMLGSLHTPLLHALLILVRDPLRLS